MMLNKAGEGLYRNPADGTYYALVKVRGKRFKASLNFPKRERVRMKLTGHTSIEVNKGYTRLELEPLRSTATSAFTSRKRTKRCIRRGNASRRS